MNLGQECLRILDKGWKSPIRPRDAIPNRRMGKIITDEEVGHMAKRHAAGVSCALIAKDMDCAESTVRRNLDKLKDGYTKAKGETKRNAKLNEKKVRAIRKAKDVTQNVLAERYGISKSTVQAVLNHETWRHIK